VELNELELHLYTVPLATLLPHSVMPLVANRTHQTEKNLALDT